MSDLPLRQASIPVLTADAATFDTDPQPQPTPVVFPPEGRRTLEAERQAEAECGPLALDAARDAFAMRVQDARWRRGDDPASLRSVVAWIWTAYVVLDLVPGHPATTALIEAAEDLRFKLDPYIAQRAQAQAPISALDRARRLRDTNAAATIPAPPDPSDLCNFHVLDPDAVARWLVFHPTAYRSLFSTWSVPFPIDHANDPVLALRPTARWCPFLNDGVADHVVRWMVWRDLEAEAVANPPEAAQLRAWAVSALAGDAGPVMQELEDAGRQWYTARNEDARAYAASVRRAVQASADTSDADDEQDERAAERQDSEQRERARHLARITAYVATHPGCGINDIDGAITGKRERNADAVWVLVDQGAVVNKGTERRPKLYVAAEPTLLVSGLAAPSVPA